MFTLKLFRRKNGEGFSQVTTKILPVHHVQTMEIGIDKETLEIWAFDGPEPSSYAAYYVGKREDSMTALNDDNHWGWGLLENWEGNTTQHFRPHSYG